MGAIVSDSEHRQVWRMGVVAVASGIVLLLSHTVVLVLHVTAACVVEENKSVIPIILSSPNTE